MIDYFNFFTLQSMFDGVESQIFLNARYRSNPYELISKSIFQNRAAVKMANIDTVAKITDVERLDEEVC
jgi:cap1 methyltransferase